jgi:hypothetical protein
MLDRDTEQRRLILQELARAGHDRVDGYQRYDVLGEAQKLTKAAIDLGFHRAKEDHAVNIEVPVWPIVLGGEGVGTGYTDITGPSGDFTQASFTSAVTWADAGDHTKTFGKAVFGVWQWNFNLLWTRVVEELHFLPIIMEVLGVTVDNAVSLATILVDGSGAELTRCTYQASYHNFFDAVNSIYVTETTFLPMTYGPDVTEFNGIKVTSTNSDVTALPADVTGKITLQGGLLNHYSQIG